VALVVEDVIDDIMPIGPFPSPLDDALLAIKESDELLQSEVYGMNPATIIAAIDAWFKSIEAKQPSFVNFFLQLFNTTIDNLVTTILGTVAGQQALNSGFDSACDYVFTSLEGVSPGFLKGIEAYIGANARSAFAAFIAANPKFRKAP
jgi:hypothetical protein